MYSLNTILPYIIFIPAILAVLGSAFKPVRIAITLFFRTILGGAFLVLMNTVLSPYNIAVGVNPITAFICGVFGLPGVALVYFTKYFI